MEAGLLEFVFYVDAAGTLLVEESLSENEFEVFVRHVVGIRVLFIKACVRDIKRGAVAMC